MKRVLACIMCGCMLEEEDKDIGTCARCRIKDKPASAKKDPLAPVFDSAKLKQPSKSSAAEAQKSEEPSAPPPAPRKYRILVIDDEPTLVKLLMNRLRAQGFEVMSAGDGQEGFEIIKKEKPDLILSDVLMPKMTGYDLLQKLQKQKDGCEHIPVLIMTAKGAMKEFFGDWEIHAFMTKPIDPEELMKKIRDLLETAEKVRQRKTGKKKI